MKLFTEILFILVFLLFDSMFVYANTIDDFGKTTVYLQGKQIENFEENGKHYESWVRDEDGKYIPKTRKITGTGFVVIHNDNMYLVTAAHVVRSIIIDDYDILFNKTSESGASWQLKTLERKIPNSRWFFHPTADIAIHPFGVSEEVKELVSIPNELFITENDELPIGTKVYILGYPFGLGKTNILSPISKKAEIASRPTVVNISGASQEVKYILIDQSVAGGTSGSPVFVSPELQLIRSNTFGNMSTKLIGVVSAAISDSAGGQISLVVPAFYLKEIFKSPEFKEYERKTSKK